MNNCHERPQVLFLGNGLNRAYGGIEWCDGIEAIQTNYRIDLKSDAFKNVPYPLMTIAATNNDVELALDKKNSDRILFGVDNIDSIEMVLLDLINCGFSNILTTNYSYEVERAIDCNFKRNGTHRYLKISEFNKTTRKSLEPEKKYMLHTYNELLVESTNYRVWHIHGEGRKKESVTLSYDHYCELLKRYQDEVNIITKRHINSLDINEYESWIEWFLYGDVYMLGFGLDFSEYDIWWLIIQKQKLGKGKIYYYSPDANNGKFSLLKVLDVKIRNMEYYARPHDYKEFYKDAICDIRKIIVSSKEAVHV